MIIYKTTNLINGKIYIGQDSKNKSSYIGSGRALLNAIKKYGKENFSKEILCFCESKKDMDEKEIYYINFFNSTNKQKGYNISQGGGGVLGVSLSEDRKNLISKANKGKKLSKETRQKISKAHTGRVFTEEHKNKIKHNHHDVSGSKNPMFNKYHTEKTKNIISKKNKGNKLSEDRILQISLRTKGENNNKSKLTEKDVLKIRNLYSETNMTLTEISKLYDVQFACIEKIVKRRTWKHI